MKKYNFDGLRSGHEPIDCIMGFLLRMSLDATLWNNILEDFYSYYAFTPESLAHEFVINQNEHPIESSTPLDRAFKLQRQLLALFICRKELKGADTDDEENSWDYTDFNGYSFPFHLNRLSIDNNH